MVVIKHASRKPSLFGSTPPACTPLARTPHLNLWRYLKGSTPSARTPLARTPLSLWRNRGVYAPSACALSTYTLRTYALSAYCCRRCRRRSPRRFSFQRAREKGSDINKAIVNGTAVKKQIEPKTEKNDARALGIWNMWGVLNKADSRQIDTYETIVNFIIALLIGLGPTADKSSRASSLRRMLIQDEAQQGIFIT